MVRERQGKGSQKPEALSPPLPIFPLLSLPRTKSTQCRLPCDEAKPSCSMQSRPSSSTGPSGLFLVLVTPSRYKLPLPSEL